MYFDKSSSCLCKSKENKCDLGIEVIMYMASHMPELSVCIVYANF